MLFRSREFISTTSMKIGVGVHSGPVVAGCVGSGERLEFTVIGDTVNTASRLEGATKDLGVDIVVSETVKSLAGDLAAKRAQFVELGELALRGRTQRIRAFHVSRS